MDSPVSTSLRVISSRDLPSISCQVEMEIVHICILIRNPKRNERSDLILESRGLFLKPGGFKVIDDIGNAPVGGVRQLAILNGATRTGSKVNSNIVHAHVLIYEGYLLESTEPFALSSILPKNE